jgi:hypothetical protein
MRLMSRKAPTCTPCTRTRRTTRSTSRKQRNAPEIIALLEQFGAREATAAN